MEQIDKILGGIINRGVEVHLVYPIIGANDKGEAVSYYKVGGVLEGFDEKTVRLRICETKKVAVAKITLETGSFVIERRKIIGYFVAEDFDKEEVSGGIDYAG